MAGNESRCDWLSIRGLMVVVDQIDYMWKGGGGGGTKCTANGTAARFSIQEGSFVTILLLCAFQNGNDCGDTLAICEG